jgi:hypothetical protein
MPFLVENVSAHVKTSANAENMNVTTKDASVMEHPVEAA